MVDAHEMQDGRMQVVDVYRLFDGFEAEFVGRAVNRPAFDSAARQPHGEPERIVIAAVLRATGARADLHHGRAAELRSANHERVFQKPAGLQILDHGGERLIGIMGVFPMGLNVGVGRAQRRKPETDQDGPEATTQRYSGGQSVHREMEFEGHEEKYRAVIEGATPQMNWSAKGGTRSSLQYRGEGVTHSPAAPRCLRTAR